MMKKEEGFKGQRSYMLSPAVLEAVSNHPLCERLYITDFGFYPKATFHLSKKKKDSNQHLLVYCVQGEGWYELQGERHSIKSNQAFLLPAQVPQQYGGDADKPWTIYRVHFAGGYGTTFLNYLCDQDQFIPFHLPPDHNRVAVFEDIFSHLTRTDNLDNLVYANSCFYHFLATLKSLVYKQRLGEATEQQDAVDVAISFMKAHLNQHLSLQELARQAGMSASHFSALFRKKTHNSPVNFFTCLRMQKACGLLKNSRLKVKDIAHQVGFHDPYHFTRVFTQVTGYPPKKFRVLERA